MKMLLRIYSLSFITLCLGSLSSCESDYDLTKEINGEITVGGTELAIPIGTTEKIVVDKILNITDDDGTLKTSENGDYFITMKDIVNPTKFSTPNVAINSISPTIKSISFSNNTRTATKSNADIKSFSFAIPEPFSFSTSSVIPKEIVTISSATFRKDRNGNYPTLKITLKFSDFPINMPTLSLSNLTLDLPEVMTYAPDNEIIGSKLIASGEITLTNGIGEYSKTINVTGMKLTDDDKITVDANGNKSLQIIQNLNLQGVLTTNPVAGVEPDITIIKGEPSLTFSGANILTTEGIVDIKITPIEFIYNTEFPDFMTEPGTYLDLMNASILMNIATDSPIAIEANAKITPYKNDVYIENTAIDLNIEIAPTELNSDPVTSNFWISNSNAMAPESYIWIDRNISPIVANTPERIDVNLEPKTKQEPYIVELDREYQIDFKYEFLIPLKLGGQLTINYDEDFTNIQKELSDLTDKISELILYLETDNFVPLGLTLLPVPLDCNGNLLSGVSTTIDGDVTSAEKDDSNKTIGTKGVKSKSIVTIKETTKGALKELNTIRLNIKAKSNKQTEGVMLNKNQYLILSMKAKIPNGITININE